MYRRLLVPLDGSRLAEAVLPAVERLGRLCDATILLLHVLERGAPAAVHGERHLQALDEAEAYLGEIADRLRVQLIAVETHAHEVPEGDVPRSIAEHATEACADLVVLCTHGSGGVRQLLFGSVAQQVLKHGTVPVLLVRASEGVPQPFQPARVLVPLNGTALAEKAVDPARRLAGLLGATLHLVMVVATPGTERGEWHALTQALPTATRVALELEELDATAYLEGMAARLRQEGAAVTTEVRRGEASSALADEASEPDVGLVVLATRGVAGVQAIWAGSVTARLLARTRAPILLLRAHES